ncbi:hypothetical protein Poly24_04590 [Rosistilla carotiformis]|uniref:Tll0287-like domain-containing protein n=1 Tax=Rosistilla carotiformis TaxID=2528017 RepID=A0A518JMK2_9BACT|nr:DUF3365 domain-containing protein [Rosistilla carotiformis]QDV66771.1 hypothetical protein Poly24_04590 [Rosistilla carotiformis]
MKYRFTAIGLLLAFGFSLLAVSADEPTGEPTAMEVAAPATLSEARSRATLLHETLHGTLQVVHRDFFDEDDSHTIPSASLEDVFEALADSFQVDLKWLVVNTDIVNVDHRPEDAFERAAVKALAAGKPYFDGVEGDRYRFAGPIRLASQCLKCHVKHRTSTHNRTAGLLISMPLKLEHSPSQR